MKISYYSDTDSMYIDLSYRTSEDSKEVSPGVVIDYDKNGNIVGIDIDNASNKVDIKELVINKLPVQKQVIAS